MVLEKLGAEGERQMSLAGVPVISPLHRTTTACGDLQAVQ